MDKAYEMVTDPRFSEAFRSRLGRFPVIRGTAWREYLVELATIAGAYVGVWAAGSIFYICWCLGRKAAASIILGVHSIKSKPFSVFPKL